MRLFKLLQRSFFSYFVLSALTANAQPPLPRPVTAHDFLGRDAPNIVYDIETDSQGFVYMCTQIGVKKFNGNTISPVPHASNSKCVGHIMLYKDFFHRIWIQSPRGITYIENDSIMPFPLPDSLVKLFHLGCESVYRDEDSILHLAPRGYGYYKLYPDGSIQEVIGRSSGYNCFVLTHLKDGTPFSFSIRKPRTDSLFIAYFDSSGIHKVCTTSHDMLNHTSSVAAHNDGSVSLSIGHRDIIRIKKDSLISHTLFPQVVVQLFTDSRNDLWVSTLGHGLFQCPNGIISTDRKFWEATDAVVAEDPEVGLWVKSSDRGFSLIPRLMIPHYSEETGHPHMQKVRHIVTNGKDVFCYAPPDGLYNASNGLKYTPCVKQKHPANIQPSYNYPFKVLSDRDRGLIWMSFWGAVVSWDGAEQWNTYAFSNEKLSQTPIKHIALRPDGTIICFADDRLFAVQNGALTPISEKSRGRVYDITCDKEGTIWVARSNGVVQLRDSQFVSPGFISEEPFKQKFLRVFEALNSIWLCTVQKQLMRIKGADLEMIHDDGGNTLIVSGYSIAPNGDLWLSTFRDNRFSLRRLTEPDNHLQIDYYDFNDQASRSYIHSFSSLLATDDMIYWASHQGLFVQAINELKSEIRLIKTAVTGVFVNYHPVEMKSKFFNKYHENTVSVSFDGISFKGFPVEYRYQMTGLDSVMRYPKYPQVQFTNLAPGSYDFSVQARTKSDVAWGPPTTLQFNIATPFWKTMWFQITSIISLLVMVVFIVRLWTNSTRQKEQKKAQISLEMSQLELKALKAQINPHFIFNAMSSVSYYLAKNQAEDAKTYLLRFTKLVRNVLENSEKNSLPLSEEMALLKAYVALESQRFKGDAIDLDISYDGIRADEVLIAPALFQPYIENAIWHGLKEKEGKRRIDIHFKRLGNEVACTIRDNGIGREANGQSSREMGKNRSFGMMVASRRIELINQQKTSPVHIEDLFDSTGRPEGTAVHFSFPYKINLTNSAKHHTTQTN